MYDILKPRPPPPHVSDVLPLEVYVVLRYIVSFILNKPVYAEDIQIEFREMMEVVTDLGDGQFLGIGRTITFDHSHRNQHPPNCLVPASNKLKEKPRLLAKDIYPVTATIILFHRAAFKHFDNYINFKLSLYSIEFPI